jgi:hypothetical protein
MNKIIFCAVLSIAVSAAVFSEKTPVEVGSLAELAAVAGRDHVAVTMKPGIYELNDTSTRQDIGLKRLNRNGQEIGDYPVSALLNFSGNHSTYDLSGAVIRLDTEVHREFGGRHLFKVFVSGNGNVIKNLTVHDVGDVPPAQGAIMMHVMGDDNVISGADLYIRGSAPYGYGHLLGKGGGSLAALLKQSSLLVSGLNTQLLGCKVVTRAYGHGIVLQGAVNTLIRDCYVEGEMRTTDEMLAETAGPAFDAGFASIYPPGRIVPGQIKALSEDGIRTYADGRATGRRTGPVIVENTTVKNMRSGICLGFEQGPSRIINCTVIGSQERGYSISSGGVIENSRGDAMYGPLLTFLGKDTRGCTIELELMPAVSGFPVPRLFEINGKEHHITLRNYQGIPRAQKGPIVFGESDWGDIHLFRAPSDPPSRYSGAYDITLINETGLPIILGKLSANCDVITNGEVLKDDGQNNRVRIGK